MAGLYLHIPFCRRKCSYCDFVSFADMSKADMYFVALISEIRRYEQLMSERSFNTVFIGGGTPSVLDADKLAFIVSELIKRFSVANDAEITVEVNPESITPDKLLSMRCAGVNRISIGLQSADDAVLGSIGRAHDRETFLNAFELVSKCGFNNINVDVMHGLPGQTAASYIDTLELVSSLGARHISSYALILEEGTPLYDAVRCGDIELPDEDATADMEDMGFEFLASHGYRRYEVSNFAVPGYECKHNLNYWHNGEYLGLGLNSHSAMRIGGKWARWENASALDEYMADVSSSRLPVRNMRDIEPDEELFETVMLGLRMAEGVDRAEFEKRHGTDIVTRYAPIIVELELDGMIVADETHVRLTERGMDFQNEVLVKFLDQ